MREIRRGHIPDALGRHGLQVFGSDVVAVFNRVNSGLYRIMHAVQTGCVRRDFAPLAVRLIHNGLEFFERKGRDVIEHAVWTHKVAAVAVHLDPIGAMRNLLSHSFAALLRPIHHLDAMR